MAEELNKTCVRCKQSLPREAFHNARNRPDGKYPYCRKCNSEWNKARDAADPIAAAERRARKKAYDAKYNLIHKQRKLDQVKRRYEQKSEEIKLGIKKWQANNKELVRAYKAANKARRRSICNEGITGSELLAWREAQPKKCYWCGRGCKRKYHVDHYMPLSKGGKHEISNLVISCPTCNLRKHAKDPLDFAREVGRLL